MFMTSMYAHRPELIDTADKGGSAQIFIHLISTNNISNTLLSTASHHLPCQLPATVLSTLQLSGLSMGA